LRTPAYPNPPTLAQTIQSLHSHEFVLGHSNLASWRDRVVSPQWEQLGERPPHPFHKPLVAADFVINSRRNSLYKRLVSAYPDAHAIDMESSGFAVAVSLLKVDWAVVRGLSDALEGKDARGDIEWQPIAARHAAAYAIALLAR